MSPIVWIVASVFIAALAGGLVTKVPSKFVVLLPLIALVVVLVIIKPALGLCGAVLASPLHVYRVSAGVGNLSFFRILVLLGLLSVGLYLLIKPRTQVPIRNPKPLALSALFATAFLTFEWSDPGRLSTPLGHTLFLNYGAFLLATGLLVLSIELGLVRRRTVLLMALWSSLLPLAIVLQQYIGSRSGALPPLPLLDYIAPEGPNASRSGVEFEGGFRLAGPFSDPNFLGIFCGMTFVLASLERAWVSARRWRRALDALRLACVLAVLASLSRTGMIILLLFVIYNLMTQPGRAARVARVMLPVGIAVIIAASLGLLPRGLQTTLQDRVQDRRSAAVHLETRAVAIEAGLAHPLLGIGLGRLGPVLGQPPDRSSGHGLPFTVFAEGGALGLGLVALTLGYPLWVGVRQRDGPARGGLAIALVVTVFLYDFAFILDAAAVWWALALARDDRTETRIPERKRRQARFAVVPPSKPGGELGA